MPADFLEKYDCTLTVKTPVFIGSGRKLSKIEYIYEPARKIIRVLDIRKLYEFMAERHQEQALEDYFKNPGRFNGTAMFLLSNRITSADYPKFVAYTLEDCEPLEERRDGRKSKNCDVLEFMSDPYGNPYVPGSSIKGMLRTAIAASRLRHNPGLKNEVAGLLEYSKGHKRNNYFAKEITLAEAKIFNTLDHELKKKENAVNCDLSLVKVSDSEPLSTKDLIVCKKYDHRPDGTVNTLPIFKICLKPGTQIKFTLTLESSNCESTYGKQVYSFQSIVNALKEFDEIYVKAFLSEFQDRVPVTTETRCWLGSAGFHTKTILAAVYDDEDELLDKTKQVFRETLNERVFDQHGHNFEGTKYQVSPHMRKQTKYQGTEPDFGEAVLTYTKKAI